MAELEFFLGGRDLEMVMIHQLLQENKFTLIHDGSLDWGARASAYRPEIEASLSAGRIPVLIELQDDLGLGGQIAEGKVIVVDHHGERAGKSAPTSLEQIFELLQLPSEKWTRRFALVSANDRGHVQALISIQATADELREVRADDRRAQGITPEEERQGRDAALSAELRCGGQLTVVHLPHSRTATATDVLTAELGGPGFQNLVIFSPGGTFFFGSGWIISHLKSKYPGGWWGGELPERGYWGTERIIDSREFCERLKLP